MELVVNEWLPEYFRPDAGDTEKQQAEKFLNAFMLRPDRLFIKDSSPFLGKIYRFQKQFDYDLTTREAFKSFVKFILRNPDKCTLVMEDEVQNLPTATESRLAEGNYGSDRYLFEAANLTEDKTIVTTDIRLKKHMEEDGHFQVVLLEDFLSGY
jgi:hypothetical protein